MAAGLVLLRQQKESRTDAAPAVTSGEDVSSTVLLERIRSAGI